MDVAIIPARGGSKRIPRKNIKDFCGKPIIYYSIKAAIEELFDVKVVSVNTSLRPLKRRRVGKFIGQKARHKRAIVTLAPENSITFFEEN